MANLHLLTVPQLVQSHILSYLPIADQLKLRLVCKSVKSWIDRDSTRLAAHIPTTKVATFSQFTSQKSRIPHLITNLYLENDSLAVYEDTKGINKFLRKYSSSITTLRIKRFYIGANNQKQTEFVKAFRNLKSVEIDEIWLLNSDTNDIPIPEVFQTLRVLKLGQVLVYEEGAQEESLQNLSDIPLERIKILRWLVWSLIDYCKQLTFLRVASSPRIFYDNDFDECFRFLNYIRNRMSNNSKPMQCDLVNLNSCCSSLEVLLIIGARMGVQFLNVNTKVFRRGSQVSQGFDNYIRSFASTYLINKAFNFVKKLVIKASAIQNECIIGREKGPALLPKLKDIEIIIDIGLDVHCSQAVYSRLSGNNNQRNVCFPRADQVLKFFFPEGSKYSFVHNLTIAFKDPVFPDQRKANPGRLTSLSTMIQCLPNLRNLMIVGWSGKREREVYFQLWKGFRRLTKLTIDSCSNLSPSCFIDGNGNANDPTNFRLLPELRFLQLKGLNTMPGITNRSGLGLNVFTRMGFLPFNYLTRNDADVQMATWVRPIACMGSAAMGNSVIVTRSMTKGAKRMRLT